MDSNIIYFYSLFFLIISSGLGIIFAPRMYLAVLSLFGLICFSGLLYTTLNANYLAVFQFILCGIFLSGYIFLLLKKIARLNLKLKLVSPPKIIVSGLLATIFGILTVLFFNEEFNNSLYSVFNFISEKSLDIINFQKNIFPLHLIILLLFVTAIVLRIFLENQTVSNQNEENK